jgi:hypothetical protein
MFGLGLGAKVPVYRAYFWLDLDIGVHLIQPSGDWYRGVPNTLWQLRLLARTELHKHLSVFVGPTLNVLLQLDSERMIAPGMGLKHHDILRDEFGALSYWPGFAAGVRF